MSVGWMFFTNSLFHFISEGYTVDALGVLFRESRIYHFGNQELLILTQFISKVTLYFKGPGSIRPIFGLKISQNLKLYWLRTLLTL